MWGRLIFEWNVSLDTTNPLTMGHCGCPRMKFRRRLFILDLVSCQCRTPESTCRTEACLVAEIIKPPANVKDALGIGCLRAVRSSMTATLGLYPSGPEATVRIPNAWCYWKEVDALTCVYFCRHDFMDLGESLGSTVHV